jgi:hypothetical protein
LNKSKIQKMRQLMKNWTAFVFVEVASRLSETQTHK